MSSLERYAKVRAAIEQRGDRDRVLRAEGIAPAEWIALQRRWLDALAAEVEGGGTTLAERYCRAFAEARPGAPLHAAPAEVPPATAAPASVAAPAPVLASVPAPAPAPPAKVAIPSYLQPGVASLQPAVAPLPPSVAPAAPRAVPSFAQGTAMAFEVPRGPAVPFREGAPASPLAAASPAPAKRIGSGTALAVDAPRGPATPFAGEPAAAIPPAPRAAPATPVGKDTALPSAEASAPALPFREIAVLGFDLPRYAALVAARDEPGAELAAVLAQLGIDAAVHEQIEAFWRQKLASNGLLALDFGRRVVNAQKDLAERRATRSAEPAKEAPGAPAPAAPIPELNVEQYAWLVATFRKTAPADVPAVLARFRLTADARRELEERWRGRMAADPALQQAFLAALGRHLAGGGG